MDVTGLIEGLATEFGAGNAIRPMIERIVNDDEEEELVPAKTVEELDEASWLLS
jgi:hypothetical protein